MNAGSETPAHDLHWFLALRPQDIRAEIDRLSAARIVERAPIELRSHWQALLRVMERKGAQTVADLGEDAARAWAVLAGVIPHRTLTR